MRVAAALIGVMLATGMCSFLVAVVLAARWLAGH
jgi:hypothetical protein